MVPVCSRSSRFMPWLMWGVATLFFGYQFIMRLAPGLVMQELMQKFNIGATDYGFFAAVYYCGYAGMQIPVALLLDQYNPKLIITVCALTCSFGTLMLVYTDHWTLALAGRLLIGTGSAAGFLGTSKVISLWFPEKMYTRMVGLTFTFGLLGAVYGGRPIGFLIAQFGWSTVLSIVGYLGLGITVLIALVIKNPNLTNKYSERSVSIVESLKLVVQNKKLVILAIANLLMVGTLEGFADVWGVPYLVTTHQLSKEYAAQIISCVFIGMLFGGPILATLADKVRSTYLVTSAAGVFMGFIFVLILLFSTNLTIHMLYLSFFIAGILCCYQVLVFSIGVSLVPKKISGITVAFLNCINMLGGSFFHSIIGHLLDLNWSGVMENNLQVYDTSAFNYALSIIPFTAFLGSILVLFIMPKKNSSTIPVLSE